MDLHHWKPLLVTALVSLFLVTPSIADSAAAQGRARGRLQAPPVRQGIVGRQVPRRHQEPAFARGYENGYARGLVDGRRRSRYDPVDSHDYRDADTGYSASYGARDAYKNNYRAGFRQGYEDGYRDVTR